MPCSATFTSGSARTLLERLVERVVASVVLEARPDQEPDIVYWGSTSSANGLPVVARRAA